MLEGFWAKYNINSEEFLDGDLYIDLTATDFQNRLNFSGFVFVGQSDFSNSKIMDYADFKSAIFLDTITFTGVSIRGYIDFEEAQFLRSANFNNTKFRETNFKQAKFSRLVDFRSAKFMGITYFNAATFFGQAWFINTTFATLSTFAGSIFLHHVPMFFDSQTTEGIIWNGAKFPNSKREKESTIEANIASYERLALMMSKLEKHHDRHMFWRHEMRARRALEAGREKTPARFMNGAYELFSDYGYGFGRALAWWFGHVILGAGLLFIPAPHNWAGAVNSFATSFANAHSFLGLNRGPLKTVYADYAKWDLFNVVWTVQGLLGIMFLFFLILTIRNRFKMG